jgi:hypothetical protein
LHECRLAGECYYFELPEGAIQPRLKCGMNVYGCGLVLDPEDQLSIFFTLNGKLKGELVLEVLRISKKSHAYFQLINFNIKRN